MRKMSFVVKTLSIIHAFVVASEKMDKSSRELQPGNERLNKLGVDVTDEKTCPGDSVNGKSCLSFEPNYPPLDLLNSNLRQPNSPETENTEQKQKRSVKRKRKMEQENLVALEFEVFGKVQGVFFRKFTTSKSKELGLHGWVQNTDKGTVLGELEGNADRVRAMKKWLRDTGSPKSKIVKAEFRNERNIPRFSFSSFDIRK